MGVLDQVLSRLNAIEERLNLEEANAKANTEYNSQNPIENDSLIRVSKNGVSKTITPTQILNEVPIPTYLTLNDAIDNSFVDKLGFVPTVDVNGGGYHLKLKSLPVFEDLISGNSIISGGIVHISDMQYVVWATSYVINGVHYDVPIQEFITLSNGDPLKSRFDVFLIRVAGNTPSIEVIEGIPDDNPIKPVLDLTFEVEISFRLVQPNETIDPNITVEVIYDENDGEPTEWDNTTLLVGGDLADATDPYTGATSVKLPQTVTGKVTWKKATMMTFDEAALLVFAMRGNVNLDAIQIKLINSSNGNFWFKTISSLNFLGFNFIPSTNLDWQVVSINFSDFILNSISPETEFDTIEFFLQNTNILELDWINIQSGMVQPTPPFSLEGYFENGTRANGDLFVAIGDYHDDSNGTKIKIDDANQQIKIISQSIEAEGNFEHAGGTAIFQDGIEVNDTLTSADIEISGHLNQNNVASDDSKVVLQQGGNEIGSHLGIPSGAVSGGFEEYYDDPAYPNLRTVRLWGRFDQAGAQKDFTYTIGVMNRGVTQKYALIIAMPLITGNENEFKLKLKALNTNLDFATIHFNTKGLEDDGITPEFNALGQTLEHEACIDIRVQNNENDNVQGWATPHYWELNKVLRLPDYGDDTIKEGYGLGDTNAKTGTPETIIGAATKVILVDAQGHISQLPVSVLDKEENFTAKFILDTSNNWSTFDNYLGIHQEKKTVTAGNGATPSYSWANTGIGYYKAGTILRRIELFGGIRYDDKGVTDIQVEVSIIHESVVGDGYDSDATSTKTSIFPPTAIKETGIALKKRRLYVIDLGNFVLPVGAVVTYAVKPLGTVAAKDETNFNSKLIFR